MGYCFKGNVVTLLRFVLEEPFPIDVLTTSRCLPILLFLVLIGHPLEEVSTHEVVVEVRFVPMFVVLNELIC